MQNARPHPRPTESVLAFLTRPPGDLYIHQNLSSIDLDSSAEAQILYIDVAENAELLYFEKKKTGKKLQAD